MNSPKEEERYLSIREVADRFSVSPETVKRWLRNKVLVGVQLTRTMWRISNREVNRFSKGQSKGKGT